MAALVKTVKVGKEDVCLTGRSKIAITLPAKKKRALKAIKFDAPSSKLTVRMKHIRKMAERHIQSCANSSATRRAKAVRINHLKDGRKVYLKTDTKVTKRSMLNPTVKPKTRAVSALKDRKAVMEMVRKMKIDHHNKIKKEQLTKAGKADKFVPIPYDRLKMTLPGLVKTFYGPPAPVKRIIKVTNLPAETTKKTMDIALGRCAEYVKQVKVFSPKSLAVKKGETKKQQIAYLYTDSEEMAKTVLRHRGSSIKLSGKTAKMSLVALKRAPICKRVKVAAKKASDEKKAKTKAMAKANHERHEANQKRAKKNRSRRRQPMFEGPRVLRDKKTGRCYGIKRNPEAKAPKFERKSGNAYKTMRAMVRATRA